MSNNYKSLYQGPKNNFESILSIVKFTSDLASGILGMWLGGGDINAIGNKRVKDIPGWREWEKRVMKPDMRRFIEEYRKGKPK